MNSLRDGALSSSPRVLLFSQRNIDRFVWHAAQYEFEDVISQVDAADILAPPAPSGGELTRMMRRASNELRWRARLPRVSAVPRQRVDRRYDIFFGVFHSLHELTHLQRITGWRRRVSTAVAFIIEFWPPSLPRSRDYIRLLRDFDHVFVFNRWSLPVLSELVGVPCSYLPTATDTLRFSPRPTPPPRMIDVYSYGRCNAVAHQVLLRRAGPEFYYLYQTTDGSFPLTHYLEHRELSARTLQRSKFTTVYTINDNEDRRAITGGEEALSTRYFEAAAAGVVMLGSAPRTADFDDCFSWLDAVIPMPPNEAEVEKTLDDVTANTERVMAVRDASVAMSLRRHDWVHRWCEILNVVGLPATPAMAERQNRLKRLADVAGSSDSMRESTG